MPLEEKLSLTINGSAGKKPSLAGCAHTIDNKTWRKDTSQIHIHIDEYGNINTLPNEYIPIWFAKVHWMNWILVNVLA